MFCKYCGNKLEDNAKFCNQCGKKQDDVQRTVNTENPEEKPKKLSKKTWIIIAGIVLMIAIIFVAVKSGNHNSNEVTDTDESSTYVTGLRTEESKYQNTNSYNIPCNGNSDIAIEAANVFADKYGGSGSDWNLMSVDASVSGGTGTYRYIYDWAGNRYTATTTFEITDYGSYRNYTWSGDFVDLFYGN